MMFPNTDQPKIDMTPRNTNSIASASPNLDFVEMVWENNALVMRHHNSNPSGGSSSGFTRFFGTMTRFEYEDSDNVSPRPVTESDNYDTNTMKMTNVSNFGNKPSDYVNSKSNKRSAEEKDHMIERVVNKKGKTIVVDPSNEFVAPQGDSLVPDELSTPMVGAMEDTMTKMIESADHLVPGPDTSIAASNDAPTTWTDTIYEESDSVYLESQQWPEEYEDREPARRTSNYARNRSSLRSRFEKKRRDRINKKMRALQVLLPNSNKVDKASVLDEAIEYVKSLQLQLQLWSSGTHMFTSPMMMLQIPMANLNQFSAAAAAMGLGMGANFHHQFPVSGMHGFPQMPCFPYMPPFLGGPSLRSAMAVPETSSIDQVGSTPPMSDSNYSSYPSDFSQMGSELEPRQKK